MDWGLVTFTMISRIPIAILVRFYGVRVPHARVSLFDCRYNAIVVVSATVFMVSFALVPVFIPDIAIIAVVRFIV